MQSCGRLYRALTEIGAFMNSVQYMKTAARWISVSTIAAALIITFYCESGVRSRPQIIPLVDNRPFENAKAMSHLASTQEEREFSAQILNSADEELDVVFSMAGSLRIGNFLSATFSQA